MTEPAPDHLPAGAAGQRAPRRDRRGDPRPPGRRRRRRDRLGQDDPAAEDLPRARPRRRDGADRPHPAPPDRRADRRRADRRGAGDRRSASSSATRCGSPTDVEDDTLVKLMTDGILLAEIQRDRLLRSYDTIIIDEAHERSLNIDFLLGYLKRLLPQRPDLKLIITSATIDSDRFAKHFDGARRRGLGPHLPGRDPLPAARSARGDEDDEGEVVVRDQTEAIVDAVDELSRRGPGRHPGVPVRRARDPRHRRRARRRHGACRRHSRCCRCTRGSPPPSSTGCSSRTPGTPGRAVHQRRRDVADRARASGTSSTRAPRGSRRYSRADQGAAAADRADLAGVGQPALGPLRSRRATASASGSTPRRTSTAAPSSPSRRSCAPTWRRSSCRWRALGLGDIARLPVRRPAGHAQRPRRRRSCSTSSAPLDRRAAADSTTESALTEVGRRLAQLPIDPRLARMILEAERLGCVREVMVIAAALSHPGPARAPGRARSAGRPAARPVRRRDSDFLDLPEPVALPQGAAAGAVRQRVPADVQREYLNYLRIREWQDVESQLRQVAKEMGLERAGRPAIDHRGGAPATRPDPPRAARRAALAHRPAGGAREGTGGGRRPRASTSAPAARGSRSSRARAGPEAPAVPDGRRAGRDQPAVGARRTPRSSRSGPRSWPATWSSAPTPSRTGARSGAR